VFRRDARPLVGGSPPTPFQMLPLTTSGTARLPSVSRDGKYVAYLQIEANQHSVWVRQIDSNSDLQIVTPVPGQSVLGLAITPNTAFVDFVTRVGSQTAALWRVPLLGGPSRRLLEDVPVSSAPGWSTDGKQMAVLAADVLSGTDSLVVAAADGSGSRVIASRKEPRMYMSLARVLPPDFRPVWMPDDQSIAVLGRDEAGDLEIVTVNAKSGVESILPVRDNRDWFPGMGMALAPDNRSLMLTLIPGGGPPPQIFSARPPSTELTRLTNDLNGYAGVSTGTDLVATAQQATRSSLWVADAAGGAARQVGRDVPTELARWGIAWAGDRQIVYDAALIGGAGLWGTDITTRVSQFLIPDARVPSTSASGETLIFSRETVSEGWAVWRSNVKGSPPAKVPNAAGFCPSMTPDGSAVLFLSRQTGLQTAWILDLAEGGQPRQFAPAWVNACGIAVSPDSRFVMLQSRTTAGVPEVLILPIAGGDPIRRLNISGGPIRWTPDGRSLAYLSQDAPSNIWIQPLEGGPPRQMTRFPDQRIIAYNWSHDGKLLALARATDRSDIVLLKGVK
jgi:Tol biopolymer transport system component